MDPEPVEKWEGVLNATQEGTFCLQYDFFTRNVKGVEDCLVLNVYTHQIDSTDLRPVMFWIHGGAWFTGSGNGENDFYGPHYILDRDVVLVTINYRLGPFGFLSTEDEEAPGNYGLLDQTMALKWVRDHINRFGGDPNSVTIFGESVGGASVQHHLLSPRSEGLFHRGIIQSGGSTCRWAYSDTVGKYTSLLAEHLQCLRSTSRETVNCLREKPAEQIVFFRRQIERISAFPIGFGARIDLEREIPFLPAHPKELMQNGLFSNVPLITGMNQNEGAIVVADLLSNGGLGLEKLEKDSVYYLPSLLGLEFHQDSSKIAQKVIQHYLKYEKPYREQLTELEQLASDCVNLYCMDESADLSVQYNVEPTYIYWYTHRGQFTVNQLLGVSDDIDLGVGHLEEIPMLFSNNISPLLSCDDLKVSEMMIDYWTSFAIQGKPMSNASVTWLHSTTKEPRYLTIQAEPVLTNGRYPLKDRASFWERTLRESLSRDEL